MVTFYLQFATARAEPPWRNGLSDAVNNFSHTEHVLRQLVGGIPLTPDGSGVRAALTNNKLEQGEGKQQQYLGFPLQQTLFLDRKIGQVRGERLGGGLACFKGSGGTEGE